MLRDKSHIPLHVNSLESLIVLLANLFTAVSINIDLTTLSTKNTFLFNQFYKITRNYSFEINQIFSSSQ